MIQIIFICCFNSKMLRCAFRMTCCHHLASKSCPYLSPVKLLPRVRYLHVPHGSICWCDRISLPLAWSLHESHPGRHHQLEDRYLLPFLHFLRYSHEFHGYLFSNDTLPGIAFSQCLQQVSSCSVPKALDWGFVTWCLALE